MHPFVLTSALPYFISVVEFDRFHWLLHSWRLVRIGWLDDGIIKEIIFLFHIIHHTHGNFIKVWRFVWDISRFFTKKDGVFSFTYAFTDIQLKRMINSHVDEGWLRCVQPSSALLIMSLRISSIFNTSSCFLIAMELSGSLILSSLKFAVPVIFANSFRLLINSYVLLSWKV